MYLFELFKFNKKCYHESVLPNLEMVYCPDCGKLIKNEWYIVRCACCGVKLVAKTQGDEVVPLNHFCANCGCEEYKIEKLDQINFINVNYAVLIKREVEMLSVNVTTQCWQEKISEQPKLLVQYQ